MRGGREGAPLVACTGPRAPQSRVAEAASRRDARELAAALAAGASADAAFAAARDAFWPAGLDLAAAAGAKASGTGALAVMASSPAAGLLGVKLLLDAGADPNAGADADALLRAIVAPRAPSGEQTEVVRLLLEHGANPNRATTAPSSTGTGRTWTRRSCLSGIG